MKKIIFLGFLLSFVTYAEENPFALNENFQKIDKEQESLLSCFKDIDENKVQKRVGKHSVHTTIKSRDIMPKHEEKKVLPPIVKKVIKSPVIEPELPKKTIQPVTVKKHIKQIEEERVKVAKTAQKKWIKQKREKEALLKEKETSSQKNKIQELTREKAVVQKALVDEREIALEKEKREKIAKIVRAKKIREERAEAMRIKKLAKEKREAQKRVEEKRLSKEKVKVGVSQNKDKIQRENLVVKNITQERIVHQNTKNDLVTVLPKRKSVDEINLEEEALAKKKAAEQAYLDAIKEVDR